MSTTGSSLREALEKAYDDVEAGGETESDHTPSSEETHSYTEETPTGESSATEHSEEQSSVSQTDETKVKPKESVKTPSKLKPAQPSVAKPAKGQSQAAGNAGKGGEQGAAATPLSRAPQSWRPQTRAHWDKLPTEVQQEINKRELEVSRGLSEAATARRGQQEFQSIVRPFEALLAASGVTAMQATRNLMTTAATLQTGTPQQKAQTVANIIRAYGIDIGILDKTLAGKAPPPSVAGPDVRAIIQQELQNNPLMVERQREIEARKQALQQESHRSITEFASDPKNEYYEDLREDMADLLDLAAQRGRVMTIQEAYDRAAQAHPEISKLVEQRKRAEAAAAAKDGVSRARRASVSQPSGTPAAVGRTSARPVGARAALNQAWDDLSA
jgi:hypothetical protein